MTLNWNKYTVFNKSVCLTVCSEDVADLPAVFLQSFCRLRSKKHYFPVCSQMCSSFFSPAVWEERSETSLKCPKRGRFMHCQHAWSKIFWISIQTLFSSKHLDFLILNDRHSNLSCSPFESIKPSSRPMSAYHNRRIKRKTPKWLIFFSRELSASRFSLSGGESRCCVPRGTVEKASSVWQRPRWLLAALFRQSRGLSLPLWSRPCAQGIPSLETALLVYSIKANHKDRVAPAKPL